MIKQRFARLVGFAAALGMALILLFRSGGEGRGPALGSAIGGPTSDAVEEAGLEYRASRERLLASSEADDVAKPLQTGMVTLQAVSNATQGGLRGVRFEVYRGQVLLETRPADDQGQCIVSEELPSHFGIIARADGYFPKFRAPARVEGAASANGMRRVRIALERETSVVVQVSGSDGRRVSGVSVMAYPADVATRRRLEQPAMWPRFHSHPGRTKVYESKGRQVFAVTDARGEVYIPSLPAGEGVEIVAFGRVAETRVFRQLPADGAPLRVEIRANTDRTVTGRLVYEDGGPVFGTVVRLGEPGSLVPQGRTTSSNSEGIFRFEGISDTRIGIAVHHAGAKQQFYDLSDAVTDIGTIVLSRTVPVEGVVVCDDLGCELGTRNMLIQWFGESGILEESYVGRDGSFSATLPIGTVTMVLGNLACVLAESEVIVPTGPLVVDLSGKLGAIAFSASGEELNVQLREKIDVYRGRAQPAVRASSLMEGSGFSRNGAEYTVCGLPEGRYEMAVLEGRHLLAVFPDVRVERGQTLRLGHVGAASGACRVTVVDGDVGLPVAGVAIAVAPVFTEGLNSNMDERVATTDKDGTVLFSGLAAGEWVAYPDSRGPRSDAAVKRTITASGQRAEVELRVERPGAIRVRLYGPTESSETRTIVSVRPEEDGLARRNEQRATVSLGEDVLIEQVVPGRYQVHVDAPGLKGFAQFCDVVSGQERLVDIDVKVGIRQFRIQDTDPPVLSNVVGGRVYWEGGWASLKVIDGESGIVEARCDARMAVFVLDGYSSVVNSTPGAQQGYVVGVYENNGGAGSGEPGVVVIGSGRLVVQSPDGWLERPAVEILEVGGMSINMAADRHFNLLTQSASAREIRAVGIPVGALVQLESRGRGAVRTEGPFIVLGGEQVLRWPAQ